MENQTPDQDVHENTPMSNKFAQQFLGRLRRLRSILLRLSKTRLSGSQALVIGTLGISLITTGVVLIVLIAKNPGMIKYSNLISNSQNIEDKLRRDGFSKLTIPNRQPPFFTLSDKSGSLFGILPRETFELKTLLPISVAELNQGLNTSVPLDITQISDTQFELKPRLSLEKSKNVVVRIDGKDKAFGGQILDRNYSWAFQTRPDFAVTSTLPGDKKTNVPVNTGIEIVFNQDGFADAAKLLTITPEVEYRLQERDNALLIIPQAPLNPRTTYTVTLKKGLNLKDWSDPIEVDTVFSFQTDDSLITKSQPRLTIADNFLQLTPRQQPRVKVHKHNWSGESVKTKVYSFGSTDAFINSRQEVDKARTGWWYHYGDTPIDTSNLQLVSTVDLTLQTLPNDQNPIYYLQLPDALPVGLYLVEFNYGQDQKAQAWIQSSFLSGYVSVGRKETLVWMNRLDDNEGTNLGNVIDAKSKQSYRLNSQGVAQFTTPAYFLENPRDYLSLRTDDDRLVVLPVDGVETYYDQTISTKSPNDFWSYIYHEKLYYRPGESINVWGVVRDRLTGSTPSNIRLKVVSGHNYYNNRYTEPGKVFVDQTLTLQADGTFLTKIQLPNNYTGWTDVKLFQGDQAIKSSSFEIQDYVKPELKIDVTTDKKAIFAGESVNHQVQVMFFDGTPASQMKIRTVADGRYGGETTQTTDSYGQLNFTQETKYDPESYWRRYPRFEGVTFYPGVAQDKVVEGYGSVQVFGSSYELELESKQELAKASFSGKMHTLDLGPLNRGETEQVRHGVAAGAKISMTINKTWYEVSEDGTYYDFIEKVTKPRLVYSQKTEQVTNASLTTDSQGFVNYEFMMDANTSYQVFLSYSDPGGRVAKQELYYYFNPHFKPSVSQGRIQDSGKHVLSLRNSDNIFSVGEPIQLSLTKGDKPLMVTPKTKILFTIAKAGRMTYSFPDQSNWEIPFLKDYIPNITAAALVFDGQDYVQAQTNCDMYWSCSQYYYYNSSNRLIFDGLNLVYDIADSQLDVSLSSEQKTITPGKQAQFKVRVAKVDQPVANAQVHIAVVDQALAAIGGVKEPNLLKDLYSQIPGDILYMYYSHQDLLPDPMQAERGGGGGDNRSVFKDTAYFDVVTTDSQGEAIVTLQAPDNVTTWLVYAQALTSQLDAGQAQMSLPSTLPYFITSNFPSNILRSDVADIGLNSFGIGIKAIDQINYSVQIGSQAPINSQATAFKPLHLSLGTLPEGSYTITARGVSGDYQDGVELPITVGTSRLELLQTESRQLKSGESLKGVSTEAIDLSKPVTLKIFDQGKGVYYWRLMSKCQYGSNRIERLLARSLSFPVLTEFFGETGCKPPESLTKFQNTNGGIAQVEWGGSDLTTTAWATYIAADEFDTGLLKSYLSSRVSEGDDSVTSQIYRSWARTLLEEPDMIKLQTLSKQAVSTSDKILATLALATTGNSELALDLYFDILANTGYIKGDQILIQDHLAQDKFLTPTSMMLLSSLILDDNYSNQMYNYIYANRSGQSEPVIDVAEVIYLESALAKLPNEDTVVSIQAEGANQTITLDKGRSGTITISASSAGSYSAQVTKGQAEISTIYNVKPSAVASLPTKAELEVKRSIRNSTRPGKPIQVGDLVDVTLKLDISNTAPAGIYYLIDRLPSGLRMVENSYRYGGSKHYWEKISDQVYRNEIYNNLWWSNNTDKIVTYTARAAFPGEYTWEVTSLQSQENLKYVTFADESPTLKIERGVD